MRYAFLALALLLTSCVTTQEGTPRPPSEYPADVMAFIDDRDGCEHFIGEEPYDEERRMFLAKNITELCTGSDEKLEALRVKYATNPRVIARLASYEDL